MLTPVSRIKVGDTTCPSTTLTLTLSYARNKLLCTKCRPTMPKGKHIYSCSKWPQSKVGGRLQSEQGTKHNYCSKEDNISFWTVSLKDIQGKKENLKWLPYPRIHTPQSLCDVSVNVRLSSLESNTKSCIIWQYKKHYVDCVLTSVLFTCYTKVIPLPALALRVGIKHWWSCAQSSNGT